MTELPGNPWTGMAHLDEAKRHVRYAMEDVSVNYPTRLIEAVRQLGWAVDELIRHIEES